MGWIQPAFLLILKGGKSPLTTQKGYADDHGTCIDKTYMKKGLW